MNRIITLSALAGLPLLLVSCGGGSGSGGSSSPASTPTPVVTPTPTPTANAAPAIASANADQAARVSEAFSYDAAQGGATFSDADGDTLSYTTSFATAALGLVASGTLVSGTPSQAGTITVEITADDGNGGQVTDSFDIDVTAPAQSAAKPNILFILSDDQGLDSSAQYSVSTDRPTTPNLSALADAGIIFDNAWVSPTCSPTRAALMTGQFGSQTEVLRPGDELSSDATLLQTWLEEDPATQDYESAVIGKWHLGGGTTGPNDMGLNFFAGILRGGIQNYFNWDFITNGTTTNTQTYATTELTDQAIDWVGDQDGPWFLWLAYNAPHTPFHLPPTALHSRNLSGTDADIAANPRSYYLAAIEAMDTEFGRFWDSLDAQERADTIIIYLGDNGTPRQVADGGTALRGAKDSLYQGGISVPLFVSGRGVDRRGERDDALVGQFDLFATIAEIAGAKLPEYREGVSFAARLSDASADARETLFTESDSGWTIRNDRYKLIDDGSGGSELYDLQSDAGETSELIASGMNVTSIVNDLSAEATDLQTSEGITAASFSNLSPDCTDYVGTYRAKATDVARGAEFISTLSISADPLHCTLTSNSIPNHDFNDGDRVFANQSGTVTETYRFPIQPSMAAATTPLTLRRDNAVLLNGVKVDLLAAACFGVGNERSGCVNEDQPWRFDPMYGPNDFAVDSRNAHTQPNGAYHYHGPPPILSGGLERASGVIGFAADGFPIYGPWVDLGDGVQQVQSSYRLRAGDRPAGAGNPGGPYDGTYRDDYEYVDGAGDLDQCNGMTVNGQYAYYVTNAFPYMANCFVGTPDPSFDK